MYEKFNIPTVFFVLLCFMSITAQQENVCHDIIVVSNNVVDRDIIKKYFSEPMHFDEISFESDVIFQQEEFEYVCSFNKADDISSDDLIVALERCIKKKKFFVVKITIFTSDDSIRLHFTFEGAWTFKKIKIHNVYQGKHALLQFYLMERGDLFDESKHDHSLMHIKDYLVNGGYCDCAVTSNCEYDHRTKEVIVHIFINKGKRFSFGSHDVVLYGETEMIEDHKELCKQIKKKITHALSSRTFTQIQ